MTRSISQQDISWFLDLYEKGQLDLDPPYQRRSVWTLTDKRFFIDTVLNNYPVPPIFLHKAIDDHGHSTYHVVDGKQRLQTIIEFAAGKLRVPDDFSNITLQKKRWKELQRETREQFWNYILIVEMLPSVTDAAIRDTFERINRNSRKLQRQEIRHARYDGWFIHFVEAEAEKEEWKSFGVVTAARAKRMADVQFISELFAVNLKGQIIGFDQDWLDELYAEYDDPEGGSTISLDDFRQRIQETKFSIGQCLQVKPQILDYLKIQTHFYSLDKRFFIDTVLNNYPVPPIFLHKAIDDHGHSTYHVVDGKQRLQTIIEFAAGKLRVPDDFSNITLQKKRWKELQRETREQFWNYILIVEMLPSVLHRSTPVACDWMKGSRS